MNLIISKTTIPIIIDKNIDTPPTNLITDPKLLLSHYEKCLKIGSSFLRTPTCFLSSDIDFKELYSILKLIKNFKSKLKTKYPRFKFIFRINGLWDTNNKFIIKNIFTKTLILAKKFNFNFLGIETVKNFEHALIISSIIKKIKFENFYLSFNYHKNFNFNYNLLKNLLSFHPTYLGFNCGDGFLNIIPHIKTLINFSKKIKIFAAPSFFNESKALEKIKFFKSFTKNLNLPIVGLCCNTSYENLKYLF